LFAYSFFKPQTKRDWRSLGAFSAFLVGLFTETYGFPLTIYLLSGWPQSRYPNVDWFARNSGHLLEMMFGWRADPHLGPFHLASFALIAGGFILISAGWNVLYQAQRQDRLAKTGVYAHIRHPQYAGFVLVVFGFLLQWPTLLTLAMFPVWSSCTCASRTPRSDRRWPSSGQAYERYMRDVPALAGVAQTSAPLKAELKITEAQEPPWKDFAAAQVHVPLEPFIQHMVQVDVCEQGGDDATLRGDEQGAQAALRRFQR
jgi:protein-S-isoprenylcysteine O-methyltransferase Ste14